MITVTVAQFWGLVLFAMAVGVLAGIELNRSAWNTQLIKDLILTLARLGDVVSPEPKTFPYYRATIIEKQIKETVEKQKEDLERLKKHHHKHIKKQKAGKR